jgi:hypothetical protein
MHLKLNNSIAILMKRILYNMANNSEKTTEWNPQYITEEELVMNDQNDVRGTTIDNTIKEIKIGAGETSLHGTLDGLWLGSDQFDNADFSVDMYGHVIAKNISLTAGGIIDIAGGKIFYDSTHYLEYYVDPLFPLNAYWNFNAGSVRTRGDYYADGNIVADYENDGTGGFQVGLDAGIDHVEVINGKTFTWKKGILISVI